MIQPLAGAAAHARPAVPTSTALRPTGIAGLARRLIWPPADERDAGIKESADKSRRVRRKMAELAENGKPGGGGRWYGYAKDLQIVPEEAEVIREAARRVLAWEAIRSIAGDFHRRGIRSARGGILARNTLRSILVSGRISGQRDHLGVSVAKATWPAITTREETERLRAVFRDPARRWPGRGVSYLLSGTLRCDRCGARMVGDGMAAIPPTPACATTAPRRWDAVG